MLAAPNIVPSFRVVGSHSSGCCSSLDYYDCLSDVRFTCKFQLSLGKYTTFLAAIKYIVMPFMRYVSNLFFYYVEGGGVTDTAILTRAVSKDRRMCNIILWRRNGKVYSYFTVVI